MIQPNIIVLNHLDYVDNNVHNLTELSAQCEEFISTIETQIGQEVTCFGTGTSTLFSR